MSWPIGTVSTDNLDADTDSPLSARPDLKSAVDKLNTMVSHTEPALKNGNSSNLFACANATGDTHAVNRGFGDTRYALAADTYTDDEVDALVASAIAWKNKVINGDFTCNTREHSGTVVLAAGERAHDSWKAGSSGCTYTFSTTANITTITITAGTLVQVVEGKYFQTGTHVLSWSGTATGRVGAASFSATGQTASVTGGVNQAIEFSTGTLSRVQFELGSSATGFEWIPVDMQKARCEHYLVKIGPTLVFSGYGLSGNYESNDIKIPAMAGAITVESVGTFSSSNISTVALSANYVGCIMRVSILTSATGGYQYSSNTDGHFLLKAEV